MSDGHRYTVEIRVYGPRLDPNAVTAQTGLSPCRTRLAGSSKDKKVYADAMWGFDGDGPYDWSDREEGISYVLDRLGPAQTIIAGYKNDHNVVWWCGHFQSAFDGGPLLSQHLLKRLADFGVSLFIDTYVATEPAND